MKTFNVCQTYPKQNLIGNTFVTYKKREVEKSPIDEYFIESKRILAEAHKDATNNSLLNLYFIQLMSSVEHYYRNILYKFVDLCPYTKDVAAEKMIRIGSVLWYEKELFNLGMFEHVSFTDSSNIKTTTANFTNFSPKPKSSLEELLKDFDLLCELRHTIVHSNSQLNGKNAIRLKILKKSGQKASVNFTISKLEEAIASCNALISAYNNELFNFSLLRSAEKWPEYGRKFNLKNFKTLSLLFFSTETSTQTLETFSNLAFKEFKSEYSKRSLKT